MKVFIINLQKSTKKRLLMKSQMDGLGISDYEFVEAVDGESLSNSFIEKNVYDYPANSLTKGEIGCALSHLKAYKMMLDQGVDCGVILEDDVIIPQDFKSFLKNIEGSFDIKHSKILSLCGANKIFLGDVFFKYNGFVEYTAITAFGGFGYLINSQAARVLLNKLRPIKYEADMFMHFRENGWIDQFNILYPQYLYVIDNHDEESNINFERQRIKRNRHVYKKYILLKSRPLSIRIRNRIQRIKWKFKQLKVKE